MSDAIQRDAAAVMVPATATDSHPNRSSPPMATGTVYSNIVLDVRVNTQYPRVVQTPYRYRVPGTVWILDTGSRVPPLYGYRYGYRSAC